MSRPQRPFSLEPYHVSDEHGFILPAPLTELPPYYKAWMDVAQSIPQLIQSHVLRSHVHAMPLLDASLLKSHRELRLAHLALSMITMGYVWQDGESGTLKVLPKNVAVPFWEVSQRLGLPPILTHADGVLSNWRKKDPKGPFVMENLELIVTIPGGDSAHGFFMVTLIVELAAVPGLKAIPKVINGVQHGDVLGVTEALDDIDEALHSMMAALKMMYDYVDPDVFYGIMRIYLSGWKDNPILKEGLVYEGVQKEPMKFSGGSAAQSSVLHCFDELLGVQHKDQSGAFLFRMREYMPPAHKQLICDIAASPSLRSFVRDQASGSLLESYHRCVAQLLAFRSYHMNVVGRYITVPAARTRKLRAQGKAHEAEALSKAPAALEERGTGGSGIMSFLKTVWDRTEALRLTPTPTYTSK